MPASTPHRPSRGHAFAAALTFACTVGLAACQHAPPPPTNATPDKAVATSLRLTAAGDFDALMRNRLPPADYREWRAEWNEAHAHPMPASIAQHDQFAKIMKMLTEPGAEAKLAKRLQPELAKLRGGKNGLPIFSGILEAAGRQMIAASPQLGPAQRTLATQGLDALVAWARTTDFSNPKKARKAIDLVCAAARQLHIATLDQWRALDYADTMKNYRIIWAGLESVLDIYGLDLANSLDHASVATTSDEGSHAAVKLEVDFAGRPLDATWPMVKQDDHWYDTALLAAWRKAHPPAAVTAATTATSAAAPASAKNTQHARAASAPATSARPVPPATAASSGRPPASSRAARG